MLTSSVATALAFNLPRRSSRSSTTAACAWQTSWILGAMGGDVAVSTVVMPSGVAVGRGRPRQHSAGPGRSRSSIPQTPTRSWIHGLHQDRSVSCPFSERWLASFFYIMYIFINLSPRNGKPQRPDWTRAAGGVWPGADQRGHHIPSGDKKTRRNNELWRLMKTYEDYY